MGKVNQENYNLFLNEAEKYNFINPMLPFSGDFYLCDDINTRTGAYDQEKDMWYINAKEDKNGNNLYGKLVKDYFYYGLSEEWFTGNSKKIMMPVLESVPSNDGSNRFLRFSYLFTLISLSHQKASDNNLDNFKMDELELAENVRNEMKEIRKMHSDVLKNGINSPYYNDIKARFDSYGMQMNDHLLEKNRDMFTNLITLSRYIKMNIVEEKNIDENRIKSCYDIDKFYLLYMKSVLNFIYYFLDVTKEDKSYKDKYPNGMLHGSFVLLAQYFNLISSTQICENYNPSIKIYDYNKKCYKFYSLNDLRKEYDKLYKIHEKELSKIELTTEQADKMEITHNLDNLQLLLEITSKNNAEAINTDWDIIAPGEKKENSHKNTNTKTNNSSYNKTSIDVNDILYREMVFEKSNYILNIVGKNKFAGYVGYIYNNGTVVFEKFYEDYEHNIPAKSNATYVMNIDNFVQFTQMNKQEIIKYIKDTKINDVQRLYHSKNWKERLYRVIAGINYSDEVKLMIENLVMSTKSLNNDKKKGLK